MQLLRALLRSAEHSALKTGAGGRTRTGTALSSRGIFVPATAFAALAGAVLRVDSVWGLDYTFTVAPSRRRCCPSSLYTFAPAVRPTRLARDCLLPVPPNLGSSAPRVSPRALNRSSPLRLPFRHARVASQSMLRWFCRVQRLAMRRPVREELGGTGRSAGSKSKYPHVSCT